MVDEEELKAPLCTGTTTVMGQARTASTEHSLPSDRKTETGQAGHLYSMDREVAPVALRVNIQAGGVEARIRRGSGATKRVP